MKKSLLLSLSLIIFAMCFLGWEYYATKNNQEPGITPSANKTTEEITVVETTSKKTDSKDVKTTEKQNSEKKEKKPKEPATEKVTEKVKEEVPATEAKQETNNSGSESSNSKKTDYFDISGLTGTQADVGKVVGYSSLFGKDVTVTSVVETTTADGRKTIKTFFSNGTASSVTECEYCHGFPCPNGGGTNCSQYNVQQDASVTCQRCGKPRGDGYNGTCHGLIDWNNGGTISCNYYD